MWIEIGSLFIGLILGIALRGLVFIGGLIGGIVSLIKKSELTGLFFIPFIVGVLVGIFVVAIIKSQEKSISNPYPAANVISYNEFKENIEFRKRLEEITFRGQRDGKDGGRRI